MLQLQGLFLCSRARLNTGKIDVLGIMDEIVVNSLPAMVTDDFPLVIAALWKGESANESSEINVISPSGSVRQIAAPSLSAHYSIQLQVISLRGFRFEEQGLHKLILLYGSREVREISVGVSVIGQGANMFA